MNIFDIIGPIMIGPSSSHTAGVVRIGNVINKILGEIPQKAIIYFHGSFAKTYKGHGSDKAIIAGLLGIKPHDENVKNSFQIALEKNFLYDFKTTELHGVHPNTILVHAFKKNNEEVIIQGESIGGGNIIIRKINNIEVKFKGQYDTIIINHKDTPGMIALVSSLLSKENLNIATMNVFRNRKGGDAIMIIEIDEKLNKNISNDLKSLNNILDVTTLEGIN